MSGIRKVKKEDITLGMDSKSCSNIDMDDKFEPMLSRDQQENSMPRQRVKTLKEPKLKLSFDDSNMTLEAMREAL